jgi:NADPH:quinone reductase-like Zn-dependent oxidoreductase
MRSAMKAIQLQGYGDPTEVVKLVDLPDVGAPGPDEFIIDVEASPINGTDFMMMAGIYGFQPPLPHILGVEGVGRVSAVGRNVRHVKEGDRTLVPPTTPAWVERVKTDAAWLRPLPNADVNQLAMLGINPPTAYLLLTEFGSLRPGDWIIQNGATSSVGRTVITLAKAMGFRTINVVRRAESRAEIEKLGGDVVLIDGPDLPKRVSQATSNAKIMLAFDMVGGEATLNLLKSLAFDGTVVLYSAQSRKPFIGSSPQMIFNQQTIRGFWLVNWFKAAAPEAIIAGYAQLASLIGSETISAPIAGTYTFDKFPEAISRASQFSGGKVILKPN